MFPMRCLVRSLTLAMLVHLATPAAHAQTGLVPLNDLGAGSYAGYPGGLYPGGANVPPRPI